MIDMFSVHHTPKGERIAPNLRLVREIRLVRVYIKPDGAKNDMPSFCFVHQLNDLIPNDFVISQISAQMFRPFYEELKKIYEPKGEDS